MPGKNRKSSPTPRQTPGSAGALDGNSSSGTGALSQTTYATAGVQRRSPIILWLAGIVAALIIAYLALLLLSPGLLPQWLRFNNSSAPTPVAGQTPAAGTPQVGTEGGRISFIRATQNGAKRDLFVMNPDGTEQEQVTHDLYVEGSASWSPDGKQIISQASINGISTVVRLTIGPDNKPTDAVQLTADVKADSVLPVWSPDGKMVAFQSKKDGGQYQVFVMDADGNNKRRVSDGTGYAGQPAWSDDGKSIAYISGQDASEGTSRELYVVAASGDNPHKVTGLNATLGTPMWSPDSATIAFLQIVGQQDNRLMVVNADGTNVRTLAQNGAIKYHQFSPSGEEIVYSNVLQGANGIYKVRVSDGVTSTVRAGDDYQPAWSPDGKQLAWASTQGASLQHKIAVANADGSDMKIVSKGDGDDYQPAWSPEK